MSTLERSPTGSYRTPSLTNATVADAMHPGVMACDPGATLTEVARMMATHHVHFVAVMGTSPDESGESLTWGVITDLDVVLGGVSPGGAGTARTLANRTVISVEPTMPLADAGALMVENGVSHVLVSSPDTQHLVGVLSTLDIAGTLAWGEA